MSGILAANLKDNASTYKPKAIINKAAMTNTRECKFSQTNAFEEQLSHDLFRQKQPSADMKGVNHVDLELKEKDKILHIAYQKNLKVTWVTTSQFTWTLTDFYMIYVSTFRTDCDWWWLWRIVQLLYHPQQKQAYRNWQRFQGELHL